MTEGQTPVEVFCSYAHEDEPWLRKLETHLSLLKRQGLISFWYDRRITPGTDWASTIDAHLETASVILLLVSADFFASDYCYGNEMQRALEREAAGEARVIPLLMRPVDWKASPIAHLQVLPTDAKPIASWRSKDTALADVAAGIRRVIVEELPQLTASASRAALPKIWNVPYPRNPFFLGRESELAQIRQQLQAGQTTALSQPQAISGLGGIGKTQLALEYAYRYHQDYTAVLWARAESTDALTSSHVALAALLSLPEREAKEQEIMVQAVKTWLQKHRAWLLILDNADDLALLPAFLPPALAGHLLLTTRAVATGRLAHRVEIETLPPEQGALFLLRRAALLAPDAELSQVSNLQQELAVQISEELGGLPLALDQAGAYLEETGCSLVDYQQLYRQHRNGLLRRRGGLVADHPEPVAVTWSLSFQQAREKHPAAADLLCLFAYLAPDAIPEEILTTGASTLGPVLAPVAADPFRLNQALEVLRAYSLIQRNSMEKMLSVHRLVQAVLQDTLGEEEQRCWAERVVLAVNVTSPLVVYPTWPQCERLLTQALFAAQWIYQYQFSYEEAAHLLTKTATYLRDRSHYGEAEPLYLQALQIFKQVLGSDDPNIAKASSNLANLYGDQGKYEQAEPLYLQALQIFKQVLGPDDPNIAKASSNLANLYRQQGKYEQAELLYQRALHIREKIFGLDHPDVAYSLNNLAGLYREQGKYEQAEPLYQRALHIREKTLDPVHPEIATSLNSLAILYTQQGKYEQAELLYQRALYIREKTLGPDHSDVAYPLNNLANLYKDQGKFEQAEQLYQRALHIWEKTLGSEHVNVAYPLNNLADLYREQNKYAKAELFYRQALQIREQQLGPEHPQIAYPVNGLAKLYREQGKYAEAELLCQRALSIREQQLVASPDTAETMHDLAHLREVRGNDEEARSLYAHALAIRGQVLGAHHPKTTETRTRLIALLHTMGQHEEAAQRETAQSEL